MEEETLRDKRFASRYLGISMSTLNRWICTKTGPRYIKLNSAVKFRLSDLRAFVESNLISGSE